MQPANSYYNQAPTAAYQRTEEGFSRYIAKTYLWMFFGLAISFGISFFMYLNSATVISFIERNFGIYLVSAIGTIVITFILGFLINKMSAAVAKVLYIVYSAMFGIILAPTLMYYEFGSLIFTLAVTSIIYLILAVIGLTIKKDMSKFGNILFVALIGLVIYSVISMFFLRTALNNMLIGAVGILVFMGFTIYDSNKIKKYYFAFKGNDAMLEKTTVVSALQLYLDYINLFLYLLRFLGNSRN